MDPPPIRYARSDDGVSVAYWTLGDRAHTPLIIVPWGIGHLTAEWRIDLFRAWFERLAQRFFVVAYDARGAGLSERAVPDLSLERYAADVGDVAAAVGVHRYAILAAVWGANPAITHATAEPDRVTDLILWGPVVSVQQMSSSDTVTQAMGSLSAADYETYRHAVASLWTDHAAGADLTNQLAAMVGDAASAEEYDRFRRAAESWDVTASLPRVQARTLIFAIDQRGAPSGIAQHVAASVPQATLVIAPDRTAYPQLGDAARYAERIESFVLDSPAQQEGALGAAADQRGAGEPHRPQNPHGLTPRELEVLRFVAAGTRNAEIADALVISPATVTRHISNILGKTGLSNRAELVRYAMEHGLGGES